MCVRIKIIKPETKQTLMYLKKGSIPTKRVVVVVSGMFNAILLNWIIGQ